MEVKEIDTSELEIDPLNERNENVGPHKDDESLEESIRKQGIIQPPVARSADGDLHVVVGQRRTLAAQSVGLDTIPVIVMDWDDSEALEASITENVEAFSKGVSRSDRAAAVQKLMEINNWSPADIANELGISTRSVQYWLERTRDEWQSTSVHVDSDEGEAANGDSENVEIETHEANSERLNNAKVDEIPDRDLATIRTASNSAEEREEVVQKVAQKDLSTEDVREAKKRADRSGQSLVETVKEVSEEKDERREGTMKVRMETTFTGDYAVGLKRAARDYGTSEEKLVRKAIEDFLVDEGYL